ncbi:MAG: hypothetical protein QOK28_761 [Actinomycetota bacterium]|jgi:serine/threonine protein kinase
MQRGDTEIPAATPSIPGVTDLTLIGSGGSGLIYRGRQEQLSRDVAVKVLAAPAATAESVTRWKRELDAMGRLSNHPNIVAVYDSGLTDDGRAYLVMPFIPGGSLGDRVRAAGPLSVDEAVPIGVKIANALAAAHEAGVLHRDVKPDNVLLSPYEPQLADFGIARLIDATTTVVTEAGMLAATVNYAAPEVLAGERASEASDVYGLAATLHTALSGDVPFPHAPGANAIAVAHQIIHEDVPVLPPSVPDAVAAVIAQGMAKNPVDRPQSASAFATALAAAAAASDEATAPVAVESPAAATQTVRADAIRTVAPRAPGAAPRDRRGALVAVALALLAVAAGLLLFARTSHDNPSSPSTSTTAAVGTAARAPSTTIARASAKPVASDAAVTETARQYFTRLSNGDYAGAYAMLSPGFQAQQSMQSFESFWRSAAPVSITGNISSSGLTARVPLQMGGRANTYTLTMARGNGKKLFVDGPRPR